MVKISREAIVGTAAGISLGVAGTLGGQALAASDHTAPKHLTPDISHTQTIEVDPSAEFNKQLDELAATVTAESLGALLDKGDGATFKPTDSGWVMEYSSAPDDYRQAGDNMDDYFSGKPSANLSAEYYNETGALSLYGATDQGDFLSRDTIDCRLTLQGAAGGETETPQQLLEGIDAGDLRPIIDYLDGQNSYGEGFHVGSDSGGSTYVATLSDIGIGGDGNTIIGWGGVVKDADKVYASDRRSAAVVARIYPRIVGTTTFISGQVGTMPKQ